MNEKIKILHISSVHVHTDNRITKECNSLKSHYDVYFMNSYFEGIQNGIKYIKSPFRKNKILRIFTSWFIALPKSCSTKFKIIHIHDPELLIAFPVWKILGKKIIYDVHENYIKQLEVKDYLPKISKNIFRLSLIFMEKIAKKLSDLIIVVHNELNPSLTDNKNNIVISNAPVLDYKYRNIKRKNYFIYVGMITKERNVLKIAKILKDLDISLYIAGNCDDAKLKNKITSLKNVNFLGFLKRNAIKKYISESKCGICLFDFSQNHLISSPNKLFEYFNYGVPALASNIPSWVEIKGVNKFTYFVNPNNDNEIISAVKKINLLNNDEINITGQKANNFINKNYNWDIEETKLIKAYKNLLSK